MPDNQWYTNKDLFEQINEIQTEFHGLRSEMAETRTMIRHYNGLREEIVDVKNDMAEVSEEIADMRSQTEGRNSVGKAIREWGGWIIAVITFVLLLI